MKRIKYFVILVTVLFLYTSCAVQKQVMKTNQSFSEVDIKEYGAKGDGKTDDTKAFIEAIQAVSKSKKVLKISPGDYILKQTLKIPTHSSITIQGVGYENSILKYSGPATRSVIEYEGGYLNLNEFRITGNNLNQYGFYSEKLTYSKINSIRVFNCNIAGVAIGYGWCNSMRDCLIQECENGLEMVAGECNGLYLEHNTFLNLKGTGILFSTGNRAVKIVNCVFENIGKTGIFINASYNVDIDNCYFENIGSGGYKFNNIDFKLKACIISNGAGTNNIAAHAYPSQGIKISNCFIGCYEEEYFVYSVASIGLTIENNSFNKKNIALLGIHSNPSITMNKNVLTQNNNGYSTVLKSDNSVERSNVNYIETYNLEK